MQSLAGGSWLDIAIVVAILVSIIFGFGRGAVKTVVSIMSWFVAFYIAAYFAAEYSKYLQSYIANDDARLWLTRVIIFIVIMIIGSIIGNIVNYLITLSGLKGVDRLLGIILGTVFGVFIVGSLITVMNFFNLSSYQAVTQSLLIPYFTDITNWLASLLPDSLADSIVLPEAVKSMI